MRLRIETVAIREGDTVGVGTGRSETDPGILFVFGGEVRMMIEIGEAMVEAQEQIEVEVPEWAILARLERPER